MVNPPEPELGRNRGIALSVRKGLPLCGGQGGSAASAVAGAVAVNALLGDPLPREVLLAACLVAEETVAGRRLDNIAPALLGGIVLIRSMEPIDVIQLPVPDDLVVVLVRPDQEMRTSGPDRCSRGKSRARSRCIRRRRSPPWLPRSRAPTTNCSGARLTTASPSPARARLLPGFTEAKAAALAAGAAGSSISGSGPTAFALARGEEVAARIAEAMVAAYAACGKRSQARIGRVDRQGARVLAAESA